MKELQKNYFFTPFSILLLSLGLLAIVLFFVFSLLLEKQTSNHQQEVLIQQQLAKEIDALSADLQSQKNLNYYASYIHTTLGKWLNYKYEINLIKPLTKGKKQIQAAWKESQNKIRLYQQEQQNVNQQITKIQRNISYTQQQNNNALTASLWQLERQLFALQARLWNTTEAAPLELTNQRMPPKVRGVLRSLKSLSSQIDKVQHLKMEVGSQLVNMQQQLARVILQREQQWQNLLEVGRFNYLLLLSAVLCLLATIFLLRLNQQQQRQIRAQQQALQQQALTQLQSELDSLMEGNLALEFNPTFELTQPLSQKLNATITYIRGFIERKRQHVYNQSKTIEQLLIDSTHLKQAMDFYLQKTKQSSESIQELNEFTARNKNNSKDLFQVSKRTSVICQKTIAEVRDSYIGLMHIQEQVQASSKRVKRLGESSQEVGDVLNLINDMGEQTNVLAINAAIQASQAGEAGKGFSVVAEEIQRLAEKSTLMIEQIERLVTAIQSDTKEVSIALEETTNIVAKTTAQADDASVIMEDFNHNLRLLTNLSQSLLNSDNLHSQNLPKLIDIQHLLLELAEQAQTGMIKIQNTSADLSTQTERLGTSFKKFKLEE